MEQQELQKKIAQLKKEKDELIEELLRLKRKPEGKIGYLLLALGFILLILAVIYSHNVLALIGIALVFWGALLLYIRPTRFVRNEILESIMSEPLRSYNNLIKELEYQGTPQYISPNTLWGMRNTVIYIPKSDNTPKPTSEQLSANKTFIEIPQAITLIPLGQLLSRLLEDQLKINFSTVDINYLKNNLEKTIVEGLEIAESFHMEPQGSTVYVEMKGAIFSDVILGKSENNKQHHIGDPFNSAIACILSRSTKCPVIIEKIEKNLENNTIKTTFKLLDFSEI
jgi:hypothetical protein